MLNEFFALSKILKDFGIESKEWHKYLKVLPKNNKCFRIWISNKFFIKSIEKLNEEQINVLRKYEPSNGHSFPAFNCPALWIFNKKEEDILIDWIQKDNTFCLDTFKEWLTDDKQDEIYIRKRDKKIEDCTKKIPEKLKKYIPTKSTLSKLIEILLNKDFSFQEKLKFFILDKLEKKDGYKIILEFLLENNASVVLDFYEWEELDDDFRYPIAHEKSINFINDGLLKNEEISEQKNTNSIEKDAFGDNLNISTEKLPAVNSLPTLGNLILRSMTKEAPCNTRYGRIESESYPISEKNANIIKKTIEWLMDNKRKAKNWTIADSKELLFAYPSKLCDIAIVDIFGGSDDEDLDDSSETTASFEKKAEGVIKSLTELSTKGESIDVELFAIKSIDDGHKNISYYRNYNAQKLIEAAKDWKNGCKNIPAMDFETKIPFPLKVAKLANKLYKIDGFENEGRKN